MATLSPEKCFIDNKTAAAAAFLPIINQQRSTIKSNVWLKDVYRSTD